MNSPSVNTFEFSYYITVYNFPIAGDVAKKNFENIRKRFNKARNKVKKAKVSGCSTKESKDMAGNLDGFEFLSWLVPFITPRRTKSNIQIEQNQEQDHFDDNSNYDYFEEEILNLQSCDNPTSPSVITKCQNVESEIQEVSIEKSPSQSKALQNKATSSTISKVTGREKWKKGAKPVNQQSDKLEEKELELLNSVTKMINKEETKVGNADVAFGNLVTSNLAQLPKRIKLSCQNEIHQVMFKYMMAAENITVNQEQPLTYTNMVRETLNENVYNYEL